MTRLDDVASEDITADQITGGDAPAPAPAPEESTDCQYDYRTLDALNGKFTTCDYTNAGPGVMTAEEIEATPWDGWISCIYTKDDGCKRYDCLTPDACARVGGENSGNHHGHHSGALAWSTGVAAVVVAASTVAFL